MNKTIILIKNQIRAYVLDVTDLANKAIKYHNALPLAALSLGSSIATLGPMGIIKNSIKTVANIKSEGPLKNIIVESNKKGHIRALVGNANVITEYDDSRFNDIPIEIGIGNKGTLKVVNQIGKIRQRGEVSIVKGNITKDLAYYFDQSEQIYSAVQSSVILIEKIS